MNGNEVTVLKIVTEGAFKNLLADLKSLAKQSRKTRGAYSMTLAGADGKPPLRIEVHFPIERRE